MSVTPDSRRTMHEPGLFPQHRDDWRFLIRPLSAMAILLALLLSLIWIPQAPKDAWSPTRLVPIIGWMKGYPLYPPPGDGPIVVRMYGPVSSMVYLPTLLASTPTAAVLIGAFIDFALFILPAIWLIRRSTRGGDMTLAAIAMFVVVIMQLPVTRHSATMVTIDSPAIGLATCAMAVLIRPKNARRAALAAGIFAALSMWAKLTLAPILPAIAIYLLLTSPPRQAIRRIGIVLAVVVAISLLIVLSFGWSRLYFHLITVPGNRNWQWTEPTTWGVMLHSLRLIWSHASIAAVILAIGIVLGIRSRTEQRTWALPLLTSLLVLPLSAIAYAQVGGESNHASPIIYFWTLAGVVALAGAGESNRDTPQLPHRAWGARAAMVVIFLSALIAYPSKWSQLPRHLGSWKSVADNPNHAAYLFVLAHPGQTWFPKQPLATLMAEGKIYHFDEGLYAMQLGNVTVSPEWYASGLPANLTAAAYRGTEPEGPMTPPPGFSRVTTSPELPGWVLVCREP